MISEQALFAAIDGCFYGEIESEQGWRLCNLLTQSEKSPQVRGATSSGKSMQKTRVCCCFHSVLWINKLRAGVFNGCQCATFECLLLEKQERQPHVQIGPNCYRKASEQFQDHLFSTELVLQNISGIKQSKKNNFFLALFFFFHSLYFKMPLKQICPALCVELPFLLFEL